MKQKLIDLLKKPGFYLAVFILINLVIGLLIYKDFGVSSDEEVERIGSRFALAAYLDELEVDPVEWYAHRGQDRYYGTAMSILSRIAERIYWGIKYIDKTYQISHLTTFLIFQVGIAAMYFLGLKFFKGWTSLAVSILFGTQPLLFGHALMNPKDIPLLTVFLVAVTTGFYMVDHWVETSDQSQLTGQIAQSARRKGWLFLGSLFLITVILWASPEIWSRIDQIVAYSYTTKGESLAGKVFQLLTSSGSLEGYQILARQSYLDLQRWAVLLTPVFLVGLFYWAKRNHRLSLSADLILLGAAAAWGIAISTRVVALVAGGIVGIYALVKLKERSALPLTIYTLAASLFSFVSWPFFWFYGLPGLVKSLVIFSDFTLWQSEVLFEGQYLLPKDLPGYYMPKLISIQFTEPLVILALAGVVISLVMLWKKKTDPARIGLVLAWIFLPLIYVILAKPVLYNNFRQFLFITPPLFILAGITLEQITSRFKSRAIQIALGAVILIPGVISLVQLHPYQYIYYNEFIGGVEGAYQQYELDYWYLSLKETIEFVDQAIPPGSKILVAGPEARVTNLVENQYYISSERRIPPEAYFLFDYAILPSRYSYELLFPDIEDIFRVERDHAILLVVKQIR
ncbi:MAG: hypothetical protein ACK2T7_01260 [Anaerolineales bacterium]